MARKKNKTSTGGGNSLHSKLLAYKESGDFAGALALLKAFLDKKPRDIFARIECGKVLFYLGRHAEAAQQFQLANSVEETSEAHYCLGNVYRALDQSEEVVSSFQKSIAIKASIEALANLSLFLSGQGRQQESFDYLSRAYKMAPENKLILCNMGSMFLSRDMYDKALKFAKKAIDKDPAFYDSLVLFGKIYHTIGRYDDALAYYRQAQSLYPAEPVVSGAIAGLLEKRGEYDQARQAIKPFIDKQDATPSVGVAYASILRASKDYKKAIDYLENVTVPFGGDSAGMDDVWFELGRIYDKLGEYENAFDQYQRANRCQTKHNQEYIELMLTSSAMQESDRLAKLDKNALASLQYQHSMPFEMIFIIGMPRTGTSLLEHVLSMHSEIHGAGEMPGIYDISMALSKKFNTVYPEHLNNLSVKDAEEMALAYRDKLYAIPEGVKFVIDKTPTNFRFLGIIKLLFPAAKIIHTLRDPIDTCLSIYFQKFNVMSAPYTCDLGSIASYYKDYMKVMSYWKEVLGEQILNVEYSEMVSDPRATISRVLDFCGVGVEEACFEHTAVTRDINTPSYHQVREPIYKSSLQRWKNYEHCIPGLLQEFGAS